ADDADERACGVDDGQATDVVAIHQLGGLLERRVCSDDDQVQDHHVGDGRLAGIGVHRTAPSGSRLGTTRSTGGASSDAVTSMTPSEAPSMTARVLSMTAPHPLAKTR